MYKTVFTLAMLTACAVFAADSVKQMTEAERLAKYEADIAQQGGLVKVSGKGSVVAFDLRAKPDLDAVRASWKELVDQLHITFVAKAGSGPFSFDKVDSLMKESGGEVAVFVIEDSALPMILAAQEARWALLNVTPLVKDSPSKEVFAKRFTIGFLRAAARALGSDVSGFKSSFLGAANKPQDFDSFKGTDLTFDAQMAILGYVPSIGIEQNEFESYEMALANGYDIAPTNDVQREIKKSHEEYVAKQKQKNQKK